MQIQDAIKGVLLGIIFGGLGGLGACIWLIPDEWNLFPGDTMVFGAGICGVLGYVFGDQFFDFLRDHWHWFT